VVPAAGIEGTFAHKLALELEAFQLSSQNGIVVTPSLAVNRISAPFTCVLVKSNPDFNTTFTWYPLRSVPPGLAIDTALRYRQPEPNQLIDWAWPL